MIHEEVKLNFWILALQYNLKIDREKFLNTFLLILITNLMYEKKDYLINNNRYLNIAINEFEKEKQNSKNQLLRIKTMHT